MKMGEAQTAGLHAAQEFLIAQLHFKCNEKLNGLLAFLSFQVKMSW